MSDREPFKPSFAGSDFGMSTPGLIGTEELTSFLSDDPNEITPIDKSEPKKPKKPKVKDPEDDEEDDDDEVDNKKKAPKVLSSDELFEDDEQEEEEDKDDEDDVPTPLKKKPTPEPQKNEGQEEEAEEDRYSILAKDLVNLGVFTNDEDEEGNPVPIEVKSDKDFLDTFQSQVKKQTGEAIQKFLGQFGPEYTDMFESVFIQGVDPYEYISRQAKIEGIEAFDITTEENQEKIVRQWYRTENRSPESIEAKIVKLKNYADLEDEAKEAQRVLAAREQQKLAELGQQKQQEIARRNHQKQQYINNVHKILNEKVKAKDFDGIPVSKQEAEATYSYLTKELYETTGTKQPLTEFDKDLLELNRPENHPLKVKVAMIIRMLKTDPTMSKMAKKAVSKESDKLFTEVERKFGKTSRPAKREEESSNNYW